MGYEEKGLDVLDNCEDFGDEPQDDFCNSICKDKYLCEVER